MDQKRAESRVEIRLADVPDAAVVTSTINAAFRRAEAFLIDRDRIDLESVRTLMEKGTFLVAAENGVIVGCVYVELRGERAYLGLLSVWPKRQGAGLGSMLMNAGEAYCAKQGCRFMDLRIVNVRRELPRFYQRRGYAVTGTTPFPAELNAKIACHFVEMSKPLT